MNAIMSVLDFLHFAGAKAIARHSGGNSLPGTTPSVLHVEHVHELADSIPGRGSQIGCRDLLTVYGRTKHNPEI